MKIRGLKTKVFKYIYGQYHTYRILNQLKRNRENRIIYMGIPMHSNIGDLAQYVCIRDFFKRHYPNHVVVEVDTLIYMNSQYPLRTQLKQQIRKSDIIFFQSGYCTQDLGGIEDLMHQAVMMDYPKNKLVMLPQTIFFQNNEREEKTSEIYNAHKHLLFLSRDIVSHQKAEKMFPDIKKMLYPDIVTTLIGKWKLDTRRKGILMCVRNDSEKYYSDEDIEKLSKELETIGPVSKMDTTVQRKINAHSAGLRRYIKKFILQFSRYKLVITDRYHGTIFALIAGTPVIVIKTTDHKVESGVAWFKDIYDNNAVFVNEIGNVYKQAKKMLSGEKTYYNSPYFEKEYYDKLKEQIDNL